MALTRPDDGGDPVMAALFSLLATLKQQEALTRRALDRGMQMHDLRRQGCSHRDIVSSEDPPVLVELVSGMIDALGEASAKFRRAQALALHEEGMSMGQIGRLFGVTRQRVSALLASSRPPGDGDD
jgi:hypothetical protein